ncbi:hypothetical protein VTN96DRAFT_8003 [Rasamsonia emersonii]
MTLSSHLTLTLPDSMDCLDTSVLKQGFKEGENPEPRLPNGSGEWREIDPGYPALEVRKLPTVLRAGARTQPQVNWNTDCAQMNRGTAYRYISIPIRTNLQEDRRQLLFRILVLSLEY